MCATLMLFVVDQPSAMLTMPEEEYNPEKYSIIPLMVPHVVFTHMKNDKTKTMRPSKSRHTPNAKNTKFELP